MGTDPPRWRMLVVDDHVESASALARLLRRQGHDVAEAACVRRLALAAATPFDLLISDLGLPDGTGCALLEAMLRTRAIRGIALSGFTDDQTAREAAGGRLSCFLAKPVSFPELIAAIDEAMRCDAAPPHVSPAVATAPVQPAWPMRM